jgi:hypothetical protein
MGNGILAFINRSSGLERFFRGRAVFFDNDEELPGLLLHYHQHDDERRRLAAAGRDYVHREMSSERVAAFIIDRTFEDPAAANYPWTDC